MGETRLQREIRYRQGAAQRAIGEELRRVRLEEGVSLRTLGIAVGIDPSHLARVEAGRRSLGQDALVATATGLGCTVSTRLFRSDGPRVRDHIQVRMIEALLDALHPRWTARLEVAVYRPVRGVIDVVLQDRDTLDLVAGEGHSRLQTVEGQLRWAGQKADSLPSARGWPWSDTSDEPRIGRLLLLRSCSAMHDLVRTLPQTFRSAYPAASGEAVAALTAKGIRWPGAAIVWVAVDGSATRLLNGVPRALHRELR